MSIAKEIRNQIIQQLRPQMELLKKHCEEELRNVIEAKIYSRPKSDWYDRTHSLLKSVTSSEVIMEGDTYSFKVYIDPEKLKHFSIAGEKSKGIEPGDEVYTPPILISGHGGLGVNYPATDFLNAYIKEIEADLNQAMVKYIITKYNRKSYKK